MDQRKTGQLIGMLRREKGMTQEQLAERLLVSRRTVSRWEADSNLPDLDLLIEPADLFEVDLRAPLTGERAAREEGGGEEIARRIADYADEEKKRSVRKLHQIFLTGVLAACLSGLPSAAAIDRPAADFFTGFGQGILLGALLVGALLTGRLGARIQTEKRRLLRRGNKIRK